MTEALCHYGSLQAAGTSTTLPASTPISEGGIAFSVVGAGSSKYNGDYKKVGEKNGRYKYKKNKLQKS